MILLDTNVLSELMRPTPNQTVIEWLDEQPTADLFINEITKAEIEHGIFLLPAGNRRDKLAAASQEMFNDFQERCLAFDAPAATRYVNLVARRAQISRPISVEDAQIAAIALTHGLTLATRNTSDFAEIPELHLINPWPEQ